MSLSPVLQFFFFLRSVSMRIHEIQKAIYQGIVKGNARISFIGL